MKQMFAIELGKRRGTLAVMVKFDYANNVATFQAHANGLAIFESFDYEEAREVVLSVFELSNQQVALAN